MKHLMTVMRDGVNESGMHEHREAEATLAFGTLV